ncbi:MAG TPA: ABC-type transport auxiliary lipoprotein family protein [Candidatus Hydrogenedens sp.]|nr:ABC-type transport auxiliary lipoprotein family protein [Candidatus Hydrogenedens sp.]
MKANINKGSILIFIILASFSGCLSPTMSNTPIKYYLRPEIDELRGEPTGLTLAIRGLDYPRTITNYVTYLDEQGKMYINENEEWAEHPSDVIKKILIKSFQRTGRFQDVADAVEIKNPDVILIGEINAFYKVKENSQQKIYISVNLRIREQKSSKIIFNKNFSVESIIENDEYFIQTVNNALSKLAKDIEIEINNSQFNVIPIR